MKTLNLFRAPAALFSASPERSSNVQEIEIVSKVSVSAAPIAGNAARPRVLAQRTARQERRFAH